MSLVALKLALLTVLLLYIFNMFLLYFELFVGLVDFMSVEFMVSYSRKYFNLGLICKYFPMFIILHITHFKFKHNVNV